MTALLVALSFCAAGGTLTHAGSDDSRTPPKPGNEWGCHSAVDGATWYEWGRVSGDDVIVCAQAAPLWRTRVPGVQRAWQHTALAAWPMCYPPVGQRVLLRVRACNDDGCGPWSAEAVEFVGQEYRCYDAQGEEPCEFSGVTP